MQYFLQFCRLPSYSVDYSFLLCKYVDQWNKIKRPSHTYMINQSSIRVPETHNGKAQYLQQMMLENLDIFMERNEIAFFNFTSCTKINSKWVKNLNARPGIVKLLEENIRRSLDNVDLHNNFMDTKPKQGILVACFRTPSPSILLSANSSYCYNYSLFPNNSQCS